MWIMDSLPTSSWPSVDRMMIPCSIAAVSCSRRALLSTVAACIVQFSPPWIVFLYVVDLIGQLASGGKRSQKGRALTRNRSFSLTSG